MNKQALCEAFCGGVQVREVPIGLAISLGFVDRDGDSIDFYVARHPLDGSKFRLEDSGLLVPMLEAQGVNLDSGARAKAFQELLEQYSAVFDEDAMVLHTRYLDDDEVPTAALKFLALMLRVRDFELLTPELVESTFRDDAKEAIEDYFSDIATVKFKATIGDEYTADALITPKTANVKPVAVYFATTESRVDEAVMVWMEQRLSNKRDYEVALLLEKEKPSGIGGKSLRRAMNRVGIATFRGDETGAMHRLASFAGQGQGWVQ